jgi:hypothetical protein
MARGRRLEDVLAALGRVREAPRSPESLATVRAALAGPSGHAAGKAARLAGELGLRGLEPEMERAFGRFLEQPDKDPGCPAKTAITEALTRLEHGDPAVYLRGIRHVQMEPVFGGKVDTAVALRAACAYGLVAMGYRDALLELADLLADPEAGARVAAARAVGHRGGEDGVPLLRLRARTGESDAEVLGECFGALLRLAPRSSLPFVAALLDGPDARAEAAALALGASRLPEAFAVLRDAFAAARGHGRRDTLLLALATLRREEALEFLLELVRDAPAADAASAVAALALNGGDEALRARVAAAASGRSEPRVVQAMARF